MRMPSKWGVADVRIIIPMAGEGRRFAEKGYSFPKQLIPIRGKPMIQWVIESLQPFLTPAETFTFICQAKHLQMYALEPMLQQLAPHCAIVALDHLTEGAACTVLYGLKDAPVDADFLIVNSDQWFTADPDDFMFLREAPELSLDGIIFTFHSVHPKWSFAATKPQSDEVTAVAEKRPISHHATVGVYYFRRVQDFRDGVARMMAANKRVNNEFYVAPVYNELLAQGKRIRILPVDEFWGLGTPEEVEEFRIAVASNPSLFP